mmetsp:Transcript_25119/g.94948  ORF Transcript_25119/g.94948 Transcript_25119/m.94948 type:complete len:247 (-) Transcript_25119:1028-1768(-)
MELVRHPARQRRRRQRVPGPQPPRHRRRVQPRGRGGLHRERLHRRGHRRQPHPAHGPHLHGLQRVELLPHLHALPPHLAREAPLGAPGAHPRGGGGRPGAHDHHRQARLLGGPRARHRDLPRQARHRPRLRRAQRIRRHLQAQRLLQGRRQGGAQPRAQGVPRQARRGGRRPPRGRRGDPPLHEGRGHDQDRPLPPPAGAPHLRRGRQVVALLRRPGLHGRGGRRLPQVRRLARHARVHARGLPHR